MSYIKVILIFILLAGCTKSVNNMKHIKYLIKEGKISEAQRLLDSEKNNNLKNPNFYVLQGVTYNKMGIFDKALVNYEKAYALGARSDTFHIQIGDLYYKNNDITNALSHFRYAQKINPVMISLNYNFGLINYNAANYNTAINWLDDELKYHPEAYEALLIRGFCYNEIGEYNKSNNDLKKFLEKEKLIATYTTIIDNFYQLNEYENSMEYINKATLVFPNNYDIILSEAKIYESQGEILNCVSHCKKAIHINTDRFDAHLMLGIVYNQLGKIDSACYHINKAYQIDENSISSEMYHSCINDSLH